MSQENVEGLRRGYDLMWRDGKVDEAIAQLDPDMEWVVPGYLEGPVRHGRGPIARFFKDGLDFFEPTRIDYDFLDAGDRVVVLCDLRGRAKGSGLEVDNSFGQVWTFRQGRAVKMVWYDTHKEALEAAGLSD